MIHVLTAHYRTDRWIDIQLRYLARNLDRPYRIVADLEDVDRTAVGGFDVVTSLASESSVPVSHADKLNRLAQLVEEEAPGEDLLMFLDGDAFPIAPIGDLIEAKLDRFPLAAVRRDENLGDHQPHPCFSVTTVGFWREIGGDWSIGTWTDERGRDVADVGGKLLGILRERGIEWSPLLRTNFHDLHPIFFAVYENCLYHHGAGFRSAFSRADLPDTNSVLSLPSWLPPEPPASRIGRVSWKLRAKLWYELEKRPLARRRRRVAHKNQEVSELVFGWISADPAFYRRL